MALRDIFKKKEGGRVIGNLIRKVGDQFTGGMVSKIIPKPTAADVAEQEAKWTAQGKPFKKGDAIKALEVAPTEAMEQRATQAPEDYPESKSSTGWASMSQGKKIGIVAGLVAFVGLVIGLIVKSKKKR